MRLVVGSNLFAGFPLHRALEAFDVLDIRIKGVGAMPDTRLSSKCVYEA